MKKLLAILGSIGLTSTAASAVVACGNGGNANVGGNKSIVVNPDIANGSYDSDSKTFTAQYGSDKYQAHKMSFSLTKVVLKAENIQVVNAQGTNVDQKSGLWSFWISKNGANTVFEIEDSSLNEATVQIDLPNHLPTVFKLLFTKIKISLLIMLLTEVMMPTPRRLLPSIKVVNIMMIKKCTFR